MLNQKGSTLVILVLLIAFILIGGGAYYLGTRYNSNKENNLSVSATPSFIPTEAPNTSFNTNNSNSSSIEQTPDPSYSPNVIKTLSSPKNSFQAIEQQIGGGLYIVIQRNDKSIVCDNLAAKNFETYSQKKEYFYMRGAHIDSWADDSHLIITTMVGDENPYQYIVDATSCLADLSTIKSLK